MSDGVLITLEGGEGAGKSTQLKLLKRFLVDTSIDVIVTREPGGVPSAENIRDLLVNGQIDKWNSLTETLLHFAARHEHVSKLIQPSLEAGQWVLCDRFADSTTAYQGFAQNIDLGLISIAPQQLGNLFLITFFAAWLSSYRSRNTAEHLGQVQPLDGDPSRFLPLVGGWLLTSVIIIFHSDMSSAFVTFIIFVSMWWIAAGRIRDLAAFLTAIAGSVAVAASSIAETKSIFAAWIDPWANPELGDASIRSSFALAGGGLTGTGPGSGSADWMSGATDLFAFVPLAEELGFIGGAAILLSYLLLVGVGLRLAIAARTEFDTILATGIAIFFAGQAWASIAAVVRFLPPMGLSLPFVALNGSLLVTCNIALALLLKISEAAPNVSERTQLLPQISLEPQGDQ